MKSASSPRTGARQLGLTLLEMLISLGILASIVGGVSRLVETAGEDARVSVTALHTKTVGDAATQYIKDNYAALLAASTAATPALIRVSDLIAQGNLPSGFAATNPSSHSTCVLVLEPTAGQLMGLVLTEGGNAIDDLTLGQVAATIGGAGGGLYSTAPTTARGAMGNYSFLVGAFGNPNHLNQRCDGTAGNVTVAAGHPVMALWFADGAAGAATLYRDSVPGQPGMNTMNTPILMGAGSQQPVGAACTTPGAIASSATGAVLACEGGTWKQGGSAFWQDPVATFASLPVCNAAALSHTRVVRTPAVGAGARAYTCNGLGAWQPLGVNDAGNLTVAGTATTADLSATGTATLNRLDGTLEISSVAVAGTGCAPAGRLARTAAGALLSCESGLWTQMSSQAASGTLCGHYGDLTGLTAYCQGYNPGSSCPSGYTRVLVAISYGGCCGIYNYSCSKN